MAVAGVSIAEQPVTTNKFARSAGYPPCREFHRCLRQADAWLDSVKSLPAPFFDPRVARENSVIPARVGVASRRRGAVWLNTQVIVSISPSAMLMQLLIGARSAMSPQGKLLLYLYSRDFTLPATIFAFIRPARGWKPAPEQTQPVSCFARRSSANQSWRLSPKSRRGCG